MFRYKCEGTINKSNCTIADICGKRVDVEDLQDLVIYLIKGLSIFNNEARK